MCSQRRRVLSGRGGGVSRRAWWSATASLLLLILVFPGSLPAATESGIEIEVLLELDLRGGQLASGAVWPPLEGALTLTSAGADGESRRVPITASDGIVARLPERTVWRVAAEVDGYWSPGVVLTAGIGAGPSSRAVPLWPMGHLTGRIRLADDGDLPEELTARFASPPLTPEGVIPQATVACPVAEGGRWTCALPAGTVDLGLRAPGFVAHYSWGLKIPPGGTRSMEGALILRRGASVIGRVEVSEGKLAPEHATARLLPRVGPGGGASRLKQRLERTAASAAVHKNGFFQFAGITPGSYVAAVEHPGFATARLFPVEVFPGAETRLETPLVLRPPLTLELQISPQHDWLESPWNVTVLRASEHSAGFDDRPLHRGPAPDGRIRLPEQAPGRFSVHVADSTGNRFFHDPNVVVEGPDDAIQRIEIELVAVRGVLLLGEEPLAGTVWFGGRHGAERVRMDTTADGELAGLLPHGGTWTVEVEAAQPVLEAKLEVEIRDDDALEIRLPDTELFGRVVDEVGQPVPGARVSLSTPERHGSGAASGSEGEFWFRGFPAGQVVVSARISQGEQLRYSDSTRLPAQETLPVGPVELRLRHRTRELSARVVSVRGPVAGARVHLQPLEPPAGPGSRSHTELDGTFSAQVPHDAVLVRAIVLAPGHALQAFTVPVADEAPELWVAEVGGTLDISWPADPEALPTGAEVILLQNDHLLASSLLHQWARGHGRNLENGRLLVPNLAPGAYRLCLRIPAKVGAALAAGRRWEEALSGCSAGYLAHGSSLSLRTEPEPDPESASESR